MRLLFLLSLLVPDAACDSHRLQYFVTTAPVPIPGLPKYSIIGYIDDMPYAKYTSETQSAEIFYKWLDEKTDPEHWKEMTQRAQNFERYHRDITRLIRVLFNQTTDKHILQVKLECELHDDGTINGGLEFGYDGEEIIAFDKERVIFIPMHQEAQYITQKWNIDGMIRNKDLIERDCIRWIKMYFRLGQNKLERKVPPKVEIFDHQSDTATKLHCLAYGFYPRAVDAKWVKNSKDDVYSDVAKQILPNPDGTYQIRVTVEVIPKNEDTYGCHIDHSSLNNPMIVLWELVQHSSGQEHAGSLRSYTQGSNSIQKNSKLVCETTIMEALINWETAMTQLLNEHFTSLTATLRECCKTTAVRDDMLPQKTDWCTTIAIENVDALTDRDKGVEPSNSWDLCCRVVSPQRADASICLDRDMMSHTLPDRIEEKHPHAYVGKVHTLNNTYLPSDLHYDI
ncbi:major histocompatibility complex class I-related gene protein [Bombina bombina]|uniref:major histocompatibility complex class I-related gene protein n=1 Tax=Bombina bombina TaxID=8345 RepID=UPI00235A8C77|nr:major histocompatibility complex class I-related gene protein [Bombina bombina]